MEGETQAPHRSATILGLYIYSIYLKVTVDKSVFRPSIERKSVFSGAVRTLTSKILVTCCVTVPLGNH